MAVLLAMFQGAAYPRDVQKNLVVMKEQVLKAKKAGAQIIVFPELFLTGYCLEAEDMKSVAQESNGKAYQELSALAKETGLAILYGYPESVPTLDDGVKIYNSAQLIDKDGKSLVNYRKVHLWIDEYGYEKVFTKADGFSDVVECCGLKIGVLICYDVEFPESVRTLALRGANVVFVPTASSENCMDKITKFIIPARAYENTVHMAYANNTGTIFAGKSICCSPLGDVLASGGSDEELLFSSIDVSVTSTSYYMRDRRPLLYDI